MKILYTGRFKKHFKLRIRPKPKLVAKFKERFDIFVKSQNDPILNDHPLKGAKREYRSFSITGDVRVTYKFDDGNVIFYDIGTHNQVY